MHLINPNFAMPYTALMTNTGKGFNGRLRRITTN